MKRNTVGILLCLIICGCSSTKHLLNMSDVASNNRGRLAKLAVGMDKDQAMSVMGKELIKAKCWFWTVKVNNPYKTEILEGQGNKFEVLYYYTNPDDEFGCSIGEDNLTPLVFENQKLTGWGESFLYEVKARYGVIF